MQLVRSLEGPIILAACDERKSQNFLILKACYNCYNMVWLVTVEAVTSPIKQSKNGQSKNTTDRTIITAHEAVKICPAKINVQRGSQFVISLTFIPFHFLSSIILISQCRNGARGVEDKPLFTDI